MDYLVPFRSDIKMRILLTLLSGDKKLSDLKAVIDARETTILHVLKEFERMSLTTKDEGLYKLTPLGLIEAKICKETLAATEAISEFKDFWVNHDTTTIPEHLLFRVGALKGASLIKSDASELGKVHETFINGLLLSKKIRGISPIFHKDFVNIFAQLLNQGCTVELVLTPEVLSKTLESADAQLFQKYLTEEKLKIFVKDGNLKVALTVSDKIFSLGLFDLNGEYDYREDLISTDPQAIAWGEELFRLTVEGSKRILL
ncbi:MAG: helix-turn-helix transcriptional regulator [Candidatus Bathyarchaeia archaeon]|jgi:predicted transcriptional regulator